MLTITIPGRELYNESIGEFLYINDTKLELEHSLISLSKWESKWNKPFLTNKEKTEKEMRDYIRCMVLNKTFDDTTLLGLTSKNMKDIQDYIQAPMTATTIKNTHGRKNNEVVTSELIYCWMINLGIPFECQKWHLNRLLTLIEVCGIKQQPGKKMSTKDIMSNNAQLNAARRAAMNSKG